MNYFVREKEKTGRPLMRLAAIFLSLLFALIGFRYTAEAASFTAYPIMGGSHVTVQQLVDLYNANASYPSYYAEHDAEAKTISDFARIYMEECQAEGVNAEVAFCQMLVETGWLRFGGDVQIGQYNFAGLGATGNGVPGNSFSSVRIGIRAQVQHLKAYASTEPLKQTCVDERFSYVKRGCAPTVGGLSGTWAASTSYAESIMALVGKIVDLSAVDGSTDQSETIMYRLYNPNSGEHLYTASLNEMTTLVAQYGWRDEGVGWIAPTHSNTPVYRLYNPYSGDHHYTVDANERDQLVKIGWRDEGIGWYSDDQKGQPLYRQFNPNEVVGTHNYTADKHENDVLVSLGWRAEGIAWYGLAR